MSPPKPTVEAASLEYLMFRKIIRSDDWRAGTDAQRDFPQTVGDNRVFLVGREDPLSASKGPLTAMLTTILSLTTNNLCAFPPQLVIDVDHTDRTAPRTLAERFLRAGGRMDCEEKRTELSLAGSETGGGRNIKCLRETMSRKLARAIGLDVLSISVVDRAAHGVL